MHERPAPRHIIALVPPAPARHATLPRPLAVALNNGSNTDLVIVPIVRARAASGSDTGLRPGESVQAPCPCPAPHLTSEPLYRQFLNIKKGSQACTRSEPLYRRIKKGSQACTGPRGLGMA